MAIYLYFTGFFCTLLWPLISGADISLTSSSSDIQVNLTRSLTLTCTVHDSPPPSGSGQLVGRRDVTSGNMQFLTSLVMTRTGGEHVAAVTEHTKATARVDAGQLSVKGGMQQNEGFLELTWSFPKTTVASEYTCEANGLDADGHSVVLTSSVVVSLSQPECTDLVPIIHEHELKLDGHDASIAELMKNATSQQVELSDIKTSVQNNKNDLQSQITNNKQDLQSQITTNKQDLESQITSLKSELASLTQKHNSGTSNLQNQLNSLLASQQHIERGTIFCGDSNTFTDGSEYTSHGTYKYKDISHYFSKAYAKTPVVFVAMSSWDSGDDDLAFYVRLIRTYTNKFVVRCEGYHNEHFLHMNVDWISFSH